MHRVSIRHAGLIAMLLIAPLTACIERTVTIRTDPSDALVFLNDEEVGRSPVTVPFTWYGDYDVLIRKQGYETLKTHQKISAPWHQWPLIDLFTECFIPWTVRDHRHPPAFVLTPAVKSDKEDVLLRAEQMRERALFTK